MKGIYLVSLIAVLAVLTIAQFTGVMAGNLNAAISSVSIKGIDVSAGSSTVVAGYAGETVPLKVLFTSNVDASDAKIKAWIGGYKEDIATSTKRIRLIDGSSYSELLALELPNDVEPEEDITLYVRIETKTDFTEEEFEILIQRDSYNVNVLDIDSEKTVNAGSNLAIDIVLKNTGYEDLDDVFVIASISELGISKRAYFEDLYAEDDSDESESDSASRRVYLKIPANAVKGVYELKVEAYNSDSNNVITKNIAIVGAEYDTSVIAPMKSREISAGSVEKYDLVVINSGNTLGVYEIIPEMAEGISVSVAESVVVIPAGSSKIIAVNVKGLKEGTFNFAVNVNSAEGNLVEKVTMNAVVTGGTFGGNIAILTLVLAIIFVVLLVVLIVLLTRKPEKVEDFEESYY